MCYPGCSGFHGRSSTCMHTAEAAAAAAATLKRYSIIIHRHTERMVQAAVQMQRCQADRCPMYCLVPARLPASQ
jgi:hypothetical protein